VNAKSHLSMDQRKKKMACQKNISKLVQKNTDRLRNEKENVDTGWWREKRLRTEKATGKQKKHEKAVPSTSFKMLKAGKVKTTGAFLICDSVLLWKRAYKERDG